MAAARNPSRSGAPWCAGCRRDFADSWRRGDVTGSQTSVIDHDRAGFSHQAKMTSGNRTECVIDPNLTDPQFDQARPRRLDGRLALAIDPNDLRQTLIFHSFVF